MIIFLILWCICSIAVLYLYNDNKEALFHQLKQSQELRELKPELCENDEKLIKYINVTAFIASLFGPITLIFLIMPSYDK